MVQNLLLLKTMQIMLQRAFLSVFFIKKIKRLAQAKKAGKLAVSFFLDFFILLVPQLLLQIDVISYNPIL